MTVLDQELDFLETTPVPFPELENIIMDSELNQIAINSVKNLAKVNVQQKGSDPHFFSDNKASPLNSQMHLVPRIVM